MNGEVIVMGKGVIRISKELMLEMIMLQAYSFDITDARYDYNGQIELYVDSECIEGDKVVDILPCIANKYGLAFLHYITIDGKSLRKKLEKDETVKFPDLVKSYEQAI